MLHTAKYKDYGWCSKDALVEVLYLETMLDTGIHIIKLLLQIQQVMQTNKEFQ